jgi:hypothetical protein
MVFIIFIAIENSITPLPDYIVPVRTGTGGQAGFRDGEITEFSAFFVVPQP